ncbi:MAG: MopE-related protein [Myxococcota bacterium]
MRNVIAVVMLVGCTEAQISEPADLLMDPIRLDVGPLVPGQSLERRLTIADVSGRTEGVELQQLSLSGRGVDMVSVSSTAELPASLAAPLPLVVEFATANAAEPGLYTVDVLAEGTDGVEDFALTSRLTFDVLACDEDGDGALSLVCGGDDCNDQSSAIRPGREELCNGIDDDCNGLIDDVPDLDGDGYPLCEDCDDSDPDVFPGATERCNGVDDNCDGVTPAEELDADGDRFRGCDGDCDDGDARINPAAPELCDGRDSDCDGVIPESELDRDGDGVAVCARDCDDDDPDVFPGNPERCNGMDEDCDDVIDPDGVCPCDREELAGQIYLFCTMPRTWSDAEAVCQRWNYDLLTIDGSVEDAWAFSTLQSIDRSEKWWMGINDRRREGAFEWSSGSAVSYTNWNPNEPNDSGRGEDCGQLNRYEDGTWNDEPCSTALPYVCELNE